MRIAFDIDGVIAEQDACMLRAVDLLEMTEETRDIINNYYYLERRVLLNPLLFLAEGDELFFITGRNSKYSKITERWIKQFFPNSTLIVVNHGDPVNITNLDKWFVKQAKLKAKYINELNIGVFIDDCEEVVFELRKLCPNTKIIKYGGRLREIV